MIIDRSKYHVYHTETRDGLYVYFINKSVVSYDEIKNQISTLLISDYVYKLPREHILKKFVFEILDVESMEVFDWCYYNDILFHFIFAPCIKNRYSGSNQILIIELFEPEDMMAFKLKWG